MTPYPWEQLPNETEKTWEAFVCYRNLGVDRGIAEVSRILRKSRQLIDVWSKKYDWKRRAAAFDQENDNIRVQAHQQAIARIATQKAEAYELSTQRTLLEVARLGYSDIRKAVQWDSKGNLDFIPSDQIDDHTAAAISSLSVRYDKDGNPTKTIKFHNKLGALNLAGQKDGLWQAPKSEGSITNNYLTLIQLLKTDSVDAALAKMPDAIVVPHGSQQSDPD
jgi:hypothetical protein